MSQGGNDSSYQRGRSSISVEVLNEIAAQLNRDVSQLKTPLYECVDPDALDDLVSNSSGQLNLVEFQYEDLIVTVQSDEAVTVQVAESE